MYKERDIYRISNAFFAGVFSYLQGIFSYPFDDLFEIEKYRKKLIIFDKSSKKLNIEVDDIIIDINKEIIKFKRDKYISLDKLQFETLKEHIKNINISNFRSVENFILKFLDINKNYKKIKKGGIRDLNKI